MLYRVETGPRAGLDDTQGRKTAQHLRKALNISVSGVRQIKVFTADGLDAAQVARLLDESIWHDPILQEASLEPLPLLEPAADWFVEVGFRPGVTDNEARTARDTAAMVLDIPRDSLRVYTAVQYRISNDSAAPLTLEQVDMLARDLLCNTLIQRYRIKSRQEWDAQPGFEAQAARVTGEINETVDTIALSAMNDEALTKASRENTWALNLKEMHSIREQFTAQAEADRRKALGLPADPTDVEMEVLAQTWSEHCKHKIFASRINYTDAATGRSEVVDNLYKTCIRDATAMLRERMGENDYCKSVFKDNAGVIAFINGYDACIKVETHNSPSALDPYGGALTGIVGVNRDPMGTGMGAELVCNTDVFCFASPFHDKNLPPRLLHPRRDLANRHQQQRRIAVLGGIACGAKLQGAGCHLRLVMHGQHKNGGRIVQCANPRDGLKTVNPGHGDIQQHHIRMMFGAGIQCRLAVMRHRHHGHAGLLGQQCTQAITRQRLIVCDQHPHRFRTHRAATPPEAAGTAHGRPAAARRSPHPRLKRAVIQLPRSWISSAQTACCIG